MYLLENSGKQKWLYKVTDEGFMTVDPYPTDLWEWDEIIKYYNSTKSGHEWNVFTEEELFLEQL